MCDNSADGENTHMTDDELRQEFAKIGQRFDAMDQRFDNLESQLSRVEIEIGEVKTRLGHVETAVNRIAPKVGVPSVPALGGSTGVAAMAAKGK